MPEIPKVASDLKSYFSDAIGADAVFESPETGRPYIKVAQKGDAKLYVAVDFNATCHHPEVPKGSPQKHIKAVGIIVRFVQVGGYPESFTPPFKVRAELDGGVSRLSKYNFALCPLYGVNVAESWASQHVTEKMVDWIGGICKFAEVNAKTPNEVLAKAIEYRLELLKSEIEEGTFFDINNPTKKEEVVPKEEPASEEFAN